MIYIVLFALGVCLGSFVNALVWRLHKQIDSQGNPIKRGKKADLAKFSIARGRSMCPNCKHMLAAKDLIPVISWLALGGKCRYCQKPISKQYPTIELLNGMLFVVSYLFWPNNLGQSWQVVAFATWLVVLTGFVALSIYDVKWMLLPNRILWPLFWLAGGSLLVQVAFGRPLSELKQVFTGVLVAGGIFAVLYYLSKGAWIGGGDVKLGLLVGLLLTGPVDAFLFLFIASFLGLLYSLPLMFTKKLNMRARVPFGPFLMASAFIVVLWGQSLANWYTTTFLGL